MLKNYSIEKIAEMLANGHIPATYVAELETRNNGNVEYLENGIMVNSVLYPYKSETIQEKICNELLIYKFNLLSYERKLLFLYDCLVNPLIDVTKNITYYIDTIELDTSIIKKLPKDTINELKEEIIYFPYDIRNNNFY